MKVTNLIKRRRRRNKTELNAWPYQQKPNSVGPCSKVGNARPKVPHNQPKKRTGDPQHTESRLNA